MYDIMLDLETLGTNTNSIVASIGAAKFNPDTYEILDTFELTLRVQEQESHGRVCSARTFLWWLQQSADARMAIVKNAVPVEEALSQFDTFVGKTMGGLWGNGADFDNMILGSLYESYGRTKPWSYSQNRCYRTVRALFPAMPVARVGVHHNAKDDAVHQVQQLAAMMRSTKYKCFKLC